MEASNPPEMSLLDHFRELRSRLFKSVLGILLASGVCYAFWKEIWQFMVYPLNQTAGKVNLINTAPVEAFVTSIKVALVAGILASAPWTLWNFWRFIAPALFTREKRMVIPVLFFSTLLFLGGAAFCYFTVLPLGLKFLADYTMGDIEQSWRQGEYAGFVLKVLIAFGCTFQLPVISYVLTKTGLITAGSLWSFSRYALLIIFIAAAFLTPPDPITQLLLAIPLCVIYVISIGIAWLVGRKEKE